MLVRARRLPVCQFEIAVGRVRRTRFPIGTTLRAVMVASLVRHPRLWRYEQIRRGVAEESIAGHGIEVGALHSPFPVPRAAQVQYVDRLSAARLRAAALQQRNYSIHFTLSTTSSPAIGSGLEPLRYRGDRRPWPGPPADLLVGA